MKRSRAAIEHQLTDVAGAPRVTLMTHGWVPSGLATSTLMKHTSALMKRRRVDVNIIWCDVIGTRRADPGENPLATLQVGNINPNEAAFSPYEAKIY